MRKQTIAKILVICMLLSVMPFAGFTLGGPEVTDTTYTLTADTAIGGTLSGGTYTIEAGAYTLTGSVTVTGGTLQVSANSAYNIAATVTLSGGNFAYKTTDSTVINSAYVVAGSNYTLGSWTTSGDYATISAAYAGGSGGGGGGGGSGGGGGGGAGSGSTTTTGNTTIAVTTSISGSTVTVQTPSASALAAAASAGTSTDTVTIDLSKAGANVTTATLPTSTMEAVADLSGASGLTLKMPAGDITLPDAALNAVAAAAGTNVSISLVTSSSTASLRAVQQSTLTGLATGATISASVTSNGQAISSFGGASVTVSVPFTPPTNRPGNKFIVYHVPTAGGLERHATTYSNGKLSFTTGHFSDFVAIFEPFADAHADDWHAQYLQYVYDNGIMNGVGSDMFAPNTNLNRAMMVTTLYRIKGASGGGAAAFSDVKAGQWFSDPVGWAASVGVTSGMGDGTFAPLSNMTREQMAQFLYNYAKANGMDTSASGDLTAFSDADSVSAWAVNAMRWAVGKGYINGIDGTLAPQGTATRAQVATILTRFAQS